MQRTLASHELYHPRSTWSKLASPTMSRSGKGKAVDRGAPISSHENDYSDDDEYDDDDWKKIEDPGERRKIQNKLAQRKFRTLFPLSPSLSFSHINSTANPIKSPLPHQKSLTGSKEYIHVDCLFFFLLLGDLSPWLLPLLLPLLVT
jgi:hypothetical protein